MRRAGNIYTGRDRSLSLRNFYHEGQKVLIDIQGKLV